MKKLFTIFTMLFLISCSADNIKVHGNMIPEDEIKYIEQYETSKNDMIMMFGQPTTKSTFDDKTWYYVGQTVKYKSFMKPEVVSRKVLEVCFNDDGVVENLIGYDLADGTDLEPCKDETKSLGTDQNVIQELLGNIGKFNQATPK